MSLHKLPDADLNRFVTARAALLTPGAKGWGRPLGALQHQIIAATRLAPMSVRDVFGKITCSTMDQTINTLAGLVARGRLECVDGKWRAKAAEAAA